MKQVEFEEAARARNLQAVLMRQLVAGHSLAPSQLQMLLERHRRWRAAVLAAQQGEEEEFVSALAHALCGPVGATEE